jgi:hypothetical protein
MIMRMMLLLLVVVMKLQERKVLDEGNDGGILVRQTVVRGGTLSPTLKTRHYPANLGGMKIPLPQLLQLRHVDENDGMKLPLSHPEQCPPRMPHPELLEDLQDKSGMTLQW